MPLYSLQRAQVRLSWSVRAREDRARAARGGGSVGARPWTGGCVPARTARGRSTAAAAVACGTPKEDRGWAGQPGSRVRRHTHTLPLCGTGAGGHTSPVACRGRALQEWGAAHHHRARARLAASRFWKRFPDLDPRVQGRLQQVSFYYTSLLSTSHLMPAREWSYRTTPLPPRGPPVFPQNLAVRGAPSGDTLR